MRENKPPKFKVGDKVRVVNSYYSSVKVGHIDVIEGGKQFFRIIRGRKIVTGYIYILRDATHKRFKGFQLELIDG